MSRYDRGIGIFLFVVSVLFSIGAIRLGIGKINNFGPGFFPLLAGLFIAVCSLIIILSSLKGGRDRKDQGNSLLTGKSALIVAVLLLFGLFVEKAGFFLCTFVASLLTLRINGTRKWSYLVFVPVLICIGIFLVFNVLLEVRLPLGFLRLRG
jgi:putative tricarboxylic transport membrane protein